MAHLNIQEIHQMLKLINMQISKNNFIGPCSNLIFFFVICNSQKSRNSLNQHDIYSKFMVFILDVIFVYIIYISNININCSLFR